jgi:hypothetical protein
MPSGETLWARDSYTLFVMVTSEYQENEIRGARVALWLPVRSPV